MIRFNAAAFLILSTALSAAADDVTLRWNNGDSLSGTLLKANEKTLTWQSSLFTVPLQIELSYLASVQFPAGEVPTGDPGVFCIRMRNGDSLNGRLISITDTSMSFESMRFGTFEVARDQVLSLQRAETSGMIYAGPRGLDQWQVTKKPPNVNNGPVVFNGRAAPQEAVDAALEAADKQIWSETPDGSITTKKADTALFLPLPLPEKFEIEFDVRSTRPLNFLMAVGRNSKNGLRVETWIDVLVAAEGTAFKTLKTLGEKDLSVHLYVLVDRTAQTMQVYSDSGEKLGEVNTTGLEVDATGITFRNGDFDLAIHGLRVSHWDGKTPRIVSGNNSRLELADGTLRFGTLQGFDANTGNLILLVEEQVISVPVADIGSLVVSGESIGAKSEPPGAWLRWNDGGFVSGSLVAVADGQVAFQPPYSKRPLQCSMTSIATIGLTLSQAAGLPDTGHTDAPASDVIKEALQEMTARLKELVATVGTDHPSAKKLRDDIKQQSGKASVNDVTTAASQPDRLFHERGTLQGRLVVEGAADAPIQWTPLGGLNASTLQGVENARFVRASDVMHLSETPELLAAFPDVVYLKNHDVLPCRIDAYTEEGIQISSPLTEVRSFTHQHIRAIELTAAGRIHQSGFGADGWKGLDSKQKLKRDKLEFRGNAHYSHPEILTGDTVRLHVEWPKQAWASLTISMFGTGRRDDEDCTQVFFALQPNQLQILDRPMPQNQMMMGMQMGGRRGGSHKDGLVAVKDSRAEIQLVAHDGSIDVSIDGQPAKSIRMNPSSAGRRGIAFNANVTMMGQANAGQAIVNGRVQQRDAHAITISNFEVDNLSGASIRQFIEEESRQATLTIPRFRRDNPPTHVLIAPNGDLLRGRMLSMEGDEIVFESRLETLRLDRSRVGAIVWLDAPKKEVTKSADDGETVDAPASGPGDHSEGFTVDDEDESTLQAQLADGFSITMKPLRLVNGRIEGSSATLGTCSFPARSVRELLTGDPETRQRIAAYDTWVAAMAREPDWDIPTSDGGNSEAAALIGTIAADFELPMLDGTSFRLSDHQDKIVVLDFWATWCGPCVMALPDYIAATAKFDESKVIFIAVNLQESSDEIRSFLSEKQLAPRVALDRGAEVAPKFHVSGIPHTVILGIGSVVEDVHIGYQPGSGETIQTTIRQMLDGTWKRPMEDKPAE